MAKRSNRDSRNGAQQNTAMFRVLQAGSLPDGNRDLAGGAPGDALDEPVHGQDVFVGHRLAVGDAFGAILVEEWPGEDAGNATGAMGSR